MKWMLLLAFFEPFIYFIGESYGLKITGSATLSAVIIATIPIFTMIMGRLLFNESLSRLNVAGIIAAVLGIVLFVWNGTISSENYYGILFLFLAVAGAVGYSSICKRLTSTYNAITITTWQFLECMRFNVKGLNFNVYDSVNDGVRYSKYMILNNAIMKRYREILNQTPF